MRAVFFALFLLGPASLADGDPELARAALERTHVNVRYDGAYRQIDYPGGDVPADVGVCTDVVVRTYRAIGVDLQKLVHEDMRMAFSEYPDRWGLSRPDSNIDHRRVPNLEVFFRRHGQAFELSGEGRDYKPGDVVSWRLAHGQPHIGVVSLNLVPGTQRPMIVHNIGAGPKEEDVLFDYEIVGHFRFPRAR